MSSDLHFGHDAYYGAFSKCNPAKTEPRVQAVAHANHAGFTSHGKLRWQSEYLRRACRTREKHTAFQGVTRPSTFPTFHGLFRLPNPHERTRSAERQNGAYDSGTVFFMIVSLPADAADTICCSMDLVTLALSACDVGWRMAQEIMGGTIPCACWLL